MKIIADSPYRSWQVWAVPVALMALLLLLQLGGDAVRQWLRYDRAAIIAGQIYRFITGHFVHLGWWHLFLNELGILVLVLLCPERLAPAVWLRRLLFLSVGTSLGLYFFAPRLVWYVGMSGVIHGLFVLGLVPQALRKKDLIALGCLAYLLGKLGWETFAGVPVSDEQAIGGAVALESHLYGTLSALIYGLVFRSFTRIETLTLKGSEA